MSSLVFSLLERIGLERCRALLVCWRLLVHRVLEGFVSVLSTHLSSVLLFSLFVCLLPRRLLSSNDCVAIILNNALLCTSKTNIRYTRTFMSPQRVVPNHTTRCYCTLKKDFVAHCVCDGWLTVLSYLLLLSFCCSLTALTFWHTHTRLPSATLAYTRPSPASSPPTAPSHSPAAPSRAPPSPPPAGTAS